MKPKILLITIAWLIVAFLAGYWAGANEAADIVQHHAEASTAK